MLVTSPSPALLTSPFRDSLLPRSTENRPPSHQPGTVFRGPGHFCPNSSRGSLCAGASHWTSWNFLRGASTCSSSDPVLILSSTFSPRCDRPGQHYSLKAFSVCLCFFLSLPCTSVTPSESLAPLILSWLLLPKGLPIGFSFFSPTGLYFFLLNS